MLSCDPQQPCIIDLTLFLWCRYWRRQGRPDPRPRAAVTIQRIWRGHRVRLWFSAHRRAAVTIQSVWRGHRVRLWFSAGPEGEETWRKWLAEVFQELRVSKPLREESLEEAAEEGINALHRNVTMVGKHALIETGLDIATSLLDAARTWLPLWWSGRVGIRVASYKLFEEIFKAAGLGGVGAMLAILITWLEDVCPFIASRGPVLLTICLWLVGPPIYEYYQGRIPTIWALARQVLDQALSSGAPMLAGYAGTMVGMACCFGPIGPIIFGFAGSLVGSYFERVARWAMGRRRTDMLLHALEYQHDATSAEILCILEFSWYPFAGKTIPTTEDVQRLVGKLDSHWKRVALKYHPDKAASRGDTQEEMEQNNLQYKAAKEARNELVQLLRKSTQGCAVQESVATPEGAAITL